MIVYFRIILVAIALGLVGWTLNAVEYLEKEVSSMETNQVWIFELLKEVRAQGK